MAADYKLVKTFNSWQGLDLRSSDITRESTHATDVLNLQYRATGAMTKRKGYQTKGLSEGGCGTTTYLDLDPATGQLTEKLVVVGDTLSILNENSIDITYTGSNTAYVNLYVDTDNKFYIDVFEDNTRLLHFSLGKGYDEAGVIPVDDVKTQIDALTDFSATIVGDGTRPAATLDVVSNLIIGTSTSIKFYDWVDAALPTALTTPLADLAANKTTAGFENATFANMNGVLYVASAYTDLYKYDGTRFYRAGLPQIDEPTLALNGAGNVPGTPTYIAVYRYTDAKGNIITGIESLPVSIAASGSQVDVTLTNILDGSGFDTDVDLKIELYRNKSGGTSFFLVDEIANDGTVATQVYTDNKLDTDLSIEFIAPLKTHGLPPRMRYISVFQGLLVGTGNIQNVNTTYYSDIDSPEYFPAESNSFLIETKVGDRNTGLAPLGNSLFVFRDQSIHQVIGQLADDTFAVDYYGNARIGCSAHHTIKEVNGFLMFLSDKGVYSLNQNNQKLEEVSEIIEPLFTAFDRQYDFKRATAINWIDEDKYLLSMPVFDGTGGTTGDSRIFAYDYHRGAWLLWDNINATSGWTLFKRQLYFSEYNYSVFLGAITNRLNRFHSNGDQNDYADHEQAISFTYKSHWEHLGEPSMFKKFLRCKIHSLDSTLDDFESDSFTLELESEVDWTNNVSTKRTLDFGGGQEGWGQSDWGLFPWGNERLNSIRTKMKQTKCRSLRLIMENSVINENVLISGIELEVATPYKGFIKE